MAAALTLVSSSLLLTPDQVAAATFGEDVSLLRAHTETVVLADENGKAKVAVIPSMQGRVMTSTSEGDAGLSYGWINRELIASGQLQPHINAFGGEDRFWLGPEGGQFSIFFAKGVPFDLGHWQTPPPIDSEPYAVIKKSAGEVHLRHMFELTNYSDTEFRVKADRTVRMLSNESVSAHLPVRSLAGLSAVAYESDNVITNVGDKPWTKQTGLLSIWILGMFKHSPATTIVVPIKPGPDPAPRTSRPIWKMFAAR